MLLTHRYLEMAFMFAIIVMYLVINRQHAKNLNISLHDLV